LTCAGPTREDARLATPEPTLPTFLEVAERCGGRSGASSVGDDIDLGGAATNEASTDFDDGDDDERLQIGAPVG
jgi:hypothetical protein